MRVVAVDYEPKQLDIRRSLFRDKRKKVWQLPRLFLGLRVLLVNDDDAPFVSLRARTRSRSARPIETSSQDNTTGPPWKCRRAASVRWSTSCSSTALCLRRRLLCSEGMFGAANVSSSRHGTQRLDRAQRPDLVPVDSKGFSSLDDVDPMFSVGTFVDRPFRQGLASLLQGGKRAMDNRRIGSPPPALVKTRILCLSTEGRLPRLSAPTRPTGCATGIPAVKGSRTLCTRQVHRAAA